MAAVQDNTSQSHEYMAACAATTRAPMAPHLQGDDYEEAEAGVRDKLPRQDQDAAS